MRNMSAPKTTVSEDDIEKIFKEIDMDGDGYITPREAKRAFKKLSARFGLYDKVGIIINYIFCMIANINIVFLSPLSSGRNMSCHNCKFLNFSHKLMTGLKNVIMIKMAKFQSKNLN